MVKTISKITKNWMIFLPEKIRESLDCKRGDYILFNTDGSKITIISKKEENIKFE